MLVRHRYTLWTFCSAAAVRGSRPAALLARMFLIHRAGFECFAQIANARRIAPVWPSSPWLQGAALATHYDDPTATQLLSWGAIGVFLLVLLAYLFLSFLQFAFG
jgi:hypothetical protein